MGKILTSFAIGHVQQKKVDRADLFTRKLQEKIVLARKFCVQLETDRRPMLTAAGGKSLARLQIMFSCQPGLLRPQQRNPPRKLPTTPYRTLQGGADVSGQRQLRSFGVATGRGLAPMEQRGVPEALGAYQNNLYTYWQKSGFPNAPTWILMGAPYRVGCAGNDRSAGNDR